MRNYNYLKLVRQVFVFIFCVSIWTSGYTQPCTNFTNNNGSSVVTFQVQNTNPFAIIVTGIQSIIGTTQTNTATLYASTTSLTGVPGNPSLGGAWTTVASQTFSGIGNTTTNVPQTMMTGLNYMIPAGTTVRF